jgi:hypothetical protein
MEFRHLAAKRDALVENNRNIFSEKQDLEALFNELKVTNEKDSKTI